MSGSHGNDMLEDYAVQVSPARYGFAGMPHRFPNQRLFPVKRTRSRAGDLRQKSKLCNLAISPALWQHSTCNHDLLYQTHIVKCAFCYDSVIHNLAEADCCIQTDEC